MRRSTLALTAVVVLGAATAGVLVAANSGASGADDDADGTTPADLQFASVEQRDITRETSLDGTVGRGDPTPLTIPGEGTLTHLPAVGDTIASGQVLVEVNGAPVILLTGDRPAWRELRSGIDDGEDIRQLEQALSDLGYATTSLEIDDEWTSATTASVKNLREALGVEEDGKLALGEFVFTQSAVRIASVEGHEGDNVGDAGIEVTGEAQVVEADADTSDADVVTPGTSVTLELPNGDEVPGTVYTVGAPETDADGNSTLPVVVIAEGLQAVDGLDVEIKINVVDVAGATAVPAEALLALSEGGYAVEVPDETSATGTRLVAVELGAFDEEGWVQVTGDVAPGDQVVVP
jgi:hypothetical protein